MASTSIGIYTSPSGFLEIQSGKVSDEEAIRSTDVLNSSIIDRKGWKSICMPDFFYQFLMTNVLRVIWSREVCFLYHQPIFFSVFFFLLLLFHNFLFACSWNSCNSGMGQGLVTVFAFYHRVKSVLCAPTHHRRLLVMFVSHMVFKSVKANRTLSAPTTHYRMKSVCA